MTPRRTSGSPHRFQLLVANRSLGPGPHDATTQLFDTGRRWDGIKVELDVAQTPEFPLAPLRQGPRAFCLHRVTAHVAKLDRHGGATERRIQGL